MTLRADGRDLGQLLGYALKPKTRPGAEGDYARLMGRYLDEVVFREAFDALLDGLYMRVLHAGDLGLVITTRQESVFAYRLSAEPATWNKERAKVLRGLAHLGIAAYAYPHPDDLHDPSVRYVEVVPCEDFIRRCCVQLRARADAVAQGGVEDHVVDLALAAGLDTGWVEWEQLPPYEVGTRGRGTGRITTKSAAYWVLRAAKDLVDHGLARPVGKESDGRYQLLERYRHQIGFSAALEGYQVLTALARVDSDLPDPHDPEPRNPMPGRPPQFADDHPAAAQVPPIEEGDAADTQPAQGPTTGEVVA
ncbi:MAG: hypothetical protein ACRCZD_06815 [Phycicoccus sp.]